MAIASSPQAVNISFGETFGVPSAETVASQHNIDRLISSRIVAVSSMSPSNRNTLQ
jgi:hypothetical protein